MVTCWEKADLLALLCVMFFLCFLYFPIVFLSQAWYLIVLIPDLCHVFTNFDALVADLLLICYERDVTLSLSDNNRADVIESLKSTSRYPSRLLTKY